MSQDLMVESVPNYVTDGWVEAGGERDRGTKVKIGTRQIRTVPSVSVG